MGKKRSVLVNWNEAGGHGFCYVDKVKRPVIKPDLACVGLQCADQNLDERTLTSAIFSHQGMYLVRIQNEMRLAESTRRAEALGNTSHFRDRFAHRLGF
jgi:hypothetical protein